MIRAKFFPNLGKKWQKTDYFQEFHFSQSLKELRNYSHKLFLCQPQK